MGGARPRHATPRRGLWRGVLLPFQPSAGFQRALRLPLARAVRAGLSASAFRPLNRAATAVLHASARVAAAVVPALGFRDAERLYCAQQTGYTAATRMAQTDYTAPAADTSLAALAVAAAPRPRSGT